MNKEISGDISNNVSRKQAEEAVRILIKWAGDNPDREGLLETPARVVRSYEELYSGYKQSAEDVLQKTFSEVDKYDEMIILDNIKFESCCEHHMMPITGVVHIGYIPDTRVIGISKLARVVNIYAKRMQIQERFTSEIANAIDKTLSPKGVAVIVSASHDCMSSRGVGKRGVSMKTSHMTGLFRKDSRTREEFLSLINNTNNSRND